MSLQSRNAMFMWFQLFVDVLLRMHCKPSDRQEFINLYKTIYAENAVEMNNITEFEKNYKPEDAIRWYTLESCFYRIMNKALKTHDCDTLHTLRFWIRDIAKQIKRNHDRYIWENGTQGNIRVYRGQIIEINELELIRKSIGQLVSMNSFFSTSRNREVALTFANGYPVDRNTRKVFI